MDQKHHTVTLYSAQTEVVRSLLEQEGVCHSKEAYVAKKYGESGPIFLTAYRWFVKETAKRVPPPPGAEFPYWAFRDLYSVEGSAGDILKLEVPVEEAVFFDLYDWNRIVQLRYIGESEADERSFQRELKERGLTGNDVMLTNFYPDLKEQILHSWQRLFRHHEAICAGDASGVGGVQAGLWRLKNEWIR